MLSEMSDRPFSGKGWVFEIKYDGYRSIAESSGGRGRVLSRNLKDFTAAFPELERALAALPYEHVVVDGELVVAGDDGKPSFERLQTRARLRRPAAVAQAARDLPAVLYVFDLLGFGDFDLRPLALVHRKALLRRLLPGGGPLLYVEHLEERGVEMFEAVRRLGLEGVVAKKAGGPYVSGRSPAWLKFRATRTADLVIVGFSSEGRATLSELDLAAYDDGELVYAGSVGNGLTRELRRELRTALEPLRRPTPPCRRAPTSEHHLWVEPRLVCEVRYLTWAREGQLRHASFLRMRDDKRPEECTRVDPVIVAPASPRRSTPRRAGR